MCPRFNALPPDVSFPRTTGKIFPGLLKKNPFPELFPNPGAHNILYPFSPKFLKQQRILNSKLIPLIQEYCKARNVSTKLMEKNPAPEIINLNKRDPLTYSLKLNSPRNPRNLKEHIQRTRLQVSGKTEMIKILKRTSNI